MKTLTTRVLLGLVLWPCLVGIALAAPLEEKAPGALRNQVGVGDEPIVQELPGDLLIEGIGERRELRFQMRERWRKTKPEDRARMREEREQWRRELREGLSDEERQQLRRRMRDSERRHAEKRGLPQAERRILRDQLQAEVGAERGALRQRLRDLGPADREDLRRNLRDFRRLEAGEQETVRDNLEAFRGMPRPERDRLDENRRRWGAMSPEEQQAFRQRMRRLREMTPERRQQVLDRMLESSGQGHPGTAEPDEALP